MMVTLQISHEKRNPIDVIDYETKTSLSREEAAEVLRQIADSLARHNDLEFTRDGLRYVVDTVELEIEVGDGNSLEIESNW